MTGAGENKEIRVIARYTLHGVTKEYSKTVTLVDLDIDDDGLLNKAETDGWLID